jgi:hypothetical protein
MRFCDKCHSFHIYFVVVQLICFVLFFLSGRRIFKLVSSNIYYNLPCSLSMLCECGLFGYFFISEIPLCTSFL